MRSLLTDRFEPRQILEQTHGKITFVGTDHILEKANVLVKIIRKGHFSCDREALAKFFSWHRGIKHPHLAQVLNAGLTTNEDLYYVREYLDETWLIFSGHTAWIGQLLAAVSVLHSGSQVHGSIRPSNIFQSNGALKLADPKIFQLKPSELTQEDIRFTAPEVLLGARPSTESDLYSVGAVLYRFLSGKNPFDDFDLDNLRTKYIWATPEPLCSVCHVAGAISELVASLLEKDYRKRPDMASLRSAFPNVTRATHAPFADREDEIRTVQSFFERSSSSGLRIALIEGEPGVGKTRLIEELAARAGFSFGDYAVGHCKETDTSSFQPIMEGMDSLLRWRGVFSPSDLRKKLGNFWPTLQRRYIDSESGGKEDRNYAPGRIVYDIVGLLKSLAETRPITVAIDDVQLADDSTLQVIQQLCLRSTEISLNLILTRRSNPQPFKLRDLMEECLQEDFHAFRLGPLTPAGAQHALSYLVNSPELSDAILKAAAGNPLFLEEYAAAYPRSYVRLTPRLEGVFLSILSTLTKSSLEMAGVLSIFYKPISSESLQLVSQLSASTFESALLQLSGTGLVEISGINITFKNQSFRTHLCSRMSKSRRTRLHQLAYRLFQRRHTDEELLAYHSFHGRLHDDAAVHCLKIAKDMCEEGNYTFAITFYNRAKLCLRHLGRELDSAAKADLALCYGRVGKSARANKIYQDLLAGAPALDENRSLLSSVYIRLAVPESRKIISERLRLCSRAVETSPTDWPQLSGVYARLTQLLVQAGELANAEKALQFAHENVMRHPSESNAVFVQAARGYFLLHSGNFREAAATLQAITTGKQSILASVLTNIALCWEHLGNLTRAKESQLASWKVAESSGYALIQVLSLINLGAFETKCGNFSEASRSFTSAANLIAEFRTRDRSFRPVRISVLNLDLARLQIELGRYQQARGNLKLARKSEFLGIEGGNQLITECELNICFGDTKASKELLKLLDRSEVFRTGFFSVERALIESCLDDADLQEKLLILTQAVEVSTRIGTLYQQCRLLNQLSVVLRALGRQSEARTHAEEALRLAQTHDYKVLAAKALLSVALASDGQDKERNLLAAFHAASEIGLPELLAESAYYIGLERYTAGHYITAEEYLMKSISKTKELLEDVPRQLRSHYLSAAWRDRAPKLLQDCGSRTQSMTFLRTRPLEQNRDEQYVRALYRLTLSSATATGPDAFISSLFQTLETSIQRPVLLMLQDSENIVYHSSRIRVSDDLRDRLRTLNEKSKNRIYFGNSESGQTKDTVAWISIRAQRYTGGIYVACRHAESPLSEREVEFLTIIGTIANEALDRIENRTTETPRFDHPTEFRGMIGASKAIREVYSHIEIAAGNAATVLIEGESGTGKELVAKAIHETGQRAKEPFVAVDCGAIPESLIEAELFGAKKGSYTGAVVDRPGLFEAAHRGTIFLDEISNTSPALQVKLLRVLQEREVRRIGETRGRPIDVRLIVASNANLDALVRDGRFRKDLLYRLKVLHIKLPPLRNRRDDIPMLAHAFLERLNTANKTKKHFAAGVINHLLTQTFPGNVRELQNAIERAFFFAKGTIITEVPLEPHAEDVSSSDEVQSWFRELADGRKDFWSAVHNRYKRRDISREKVVALVDFGLRSTQGSYKTMASMFRLKEKEYRRFMDFLRRNNCLLDFRPYRKAAGNTP